MRSPSRLERCSSDIVTEYGTADLRGKSIRERTKGLIGIAHPDFREKLTAQAKEQGLL